jgi:hypothetical protein
MEQARGHSLPWEFSNAQNSESFIPEAIVIIDSFHFFKIDPWFGQNEFWFLLQQ